MELTKRRDTRAKPAALPPRPKKKPRQSRAVFTVNVILEAAEQLLRERGIKAVTTRQVALRAGVAIGTLYEYFPNRDAILIQLATHSTRKQCEAMVPTFLEMGEQGHPLPELFKLSTAHAVEMDRALMRYGRDFHVRYARHFYFGHYYSPNSTASQRKVLDYIERATLQMFSERAGEVGEGDIALAAFLVSRAVRGMVNIVIEERPELLDSPNFPAILQRVLLAIADYREPLQPGDRTTG